MVWTHQGPVPSFYQKISLHAWFSQWLCNLRNPLFPAPSPLFLGPTIPEPVLVLVVSDLDISVSWSGKWVFRRIRRSFPRIVVAVCFVFEKSHVSGIFSLKWSGYIWNVTGIFCITAEIFTGLIFHQWCSSSYYRSARNRKTENSWLLVPSIYIYIAKSIFCNRWLRSTKGLSQFHLSAKFQAALKMVSGRKN